MQKLFASAVLLGLAACGSDDHGQTVLPTPPVTQANLVCDDTMKTAFTPDANTKVLLVKAYKKGDPLLVSGIATAATPAAGNDVCVVKLLVGPGNPGPAGAPSTSPGIGIEIWLPSAVNWNNRIHVKGGGGWAGTAEADLGQLAGASAEAPSPAFIAMEEGAVSASTDTGHSSLAAGADASFAMNVDGTINTTLWQDFAERGIHEMAVKTKALTKAYYGKDAKHTYWNGFSTGGRQGLKEAQANPADFDGILVGAPAINWSKFITTELYPQTVMQRDLGGTNLSGAQLDLISNAAIDACDSVAGQHLGYIPDPSQCTYDPRKDVKVLCAGVAGVGVTGASVVDSCVTLTQATAVNKMWYGQTADGSVPDPAIDNGHALAPAATQKWYGLARGTSMAALAGAAQMPIASEMVALELQNPLLASSLFRNATGNGKDGWKSLSYADLAMAWDRGMSLQSAFSNINTDSADLSAFKARNGKLLMYHGLADVLIPAQGSINYYNRVLNQLGGLASVQEFYRLYLIPAMGHSFSNGTSNPVANPPLLTNAQLYSLLTDWVEKGSTPGIVTAANATKSRPICVYPLKAAWVAGDPSQAASYSCT
jgi:feruloyl esterase